MKRRQAKIKAEGIRWSDDKNARAENCKLGRTVERAIQEELENRERENIFTVEEEESNPGILYIEDGSSKEVYYCESWGEYWYEESNKKLDKEKVE